MTTEPIQRIPIYVFTALVIVNLSTAIWHAFHDNTAREAVDLCWAIMLQLVVVERKLEP